MNEIINFIKIEKSPFSWWRRNSKVNSPQEGTERTKQKPNKGRQKQTKNKKYTLVWTKVPVSHLFRDHQQ
jgi:hypothetical protein